MFKNFRTPEQSGVFCKYGVIGGIPEGWQFINDYCVKKDFNFKA